MKHELLIGGIAAPGAVFNYTIGKGHVNGLLVKYGSRADGTRFTIKRRTPSQTHVLCANFAFNDLQRISGIERGYGYNQGAALYKSLSEALKTKGTLLEADLLATRKEYTGVIGELFGYIDLGSMFLGADSELDISVTINPTEGASMDLRVYSVSRDRKPDYMLQYDYAVNQDQTHRQVDAVYVAAVGSTFLTMLGADNHVASLDVRISDDEGTMLSDFWGAYLATNVFESIDGLADSQICVLYRRRDAIPASVHVKVSGTDLAAVRTIIRKVIYDSSLTSINTAAEMRSLAGRLSKLEGEFPELARALRHAGEVPKAAEAAQVATIAEAKNAASGIGV